MPTCTHKVLFLLPRPFRLCLQTEKPLLQEPATKHYASGTSSVRHAAPRWAVLFTHSTTCPCDAPVSRNIVTTDRQSSVLPVGPWKSVLIWFYICITVKKASQHFSSIDFISCDSKFKPDILPNCTNETQPVFLDFNAHLMPHLDFIFFPIPLYYLYLFEDFLGLGLGLLCPVTQWLQTKDILFY